MRITEIKNAMTKGKRDEKTVEILQQLIERIACISTGGV